MPSNCWLEASTADKGYIALATHKPKTYESPVSPKLITQHRPAPRYLLRVRSGMVDGELDVLARYQFKYGCLHAVYGTPMVYVGGVIAEGLDGGATFETWQGVLDPLLAGETLGVDSGVAEFVSR